MELARQLAAIALVLSLLGVAVVLLRRQGTLRTSWKPRPSGVLAIIEQVPLGPSHRLHLVRVAGRSILIATHASGATLLDSSPWQETTAGELKDRL